jgi:hypothetical protein
MQGRLRFVVLVVAAGVVPVLAGSASGVATSEFFKTPSGKIVCLSFSDSGGGVVCGVSTGLKPPIPKAGHPECQHLDYQGNRVELPGTGRVQLLPCSGDAGPFGDPAHTVFLHYGDSRKVAGITCSEATKGLTCRNRDGHGFFLSLRSWRTF